MQKKEKLGQLYDQVSKHSQYQMLHEMLRPIIKDFDDINRHHMYEKERWEYINKKLNLKNKVCLDIGGNTGYFTLAALESQAKEIIYYEGNKNHADFMQLVCQILHIQDKIQVNKEYYIFKNNKKQVDITFLLNVLHHFGDDYGDKQINIKEAKKAIIQQLRVLANQTNFLVFQLGYNWKGNEKYPLFSFGTKKEQIEFLTNNLEETWEILNIGIAQGDMNNISYLDQNLNNIKRVDGLGEFLNRPLFIMKSKIIKGEII